eukprot:22507_1
MQLAKFLTGKKLEEPVTTTLLSSNDLKGIAEFIKSDECRKIVILAGAGISVSAGIPDFRSDDGFYNTLNVNDFPMLTESQIRELKKNPEYIFTIGLFEENPSVYLHARKQFLLSRTKYKPTLTHWFFKLLEEKKLLKRFYSTNIDGLDVATNMDPNILIHVHGTCGNAICYKCKKPYALNKLNPLLENNAHLKEFIRCDKCEKDKNFVRPNTVLFGESLPEIYWWLIDKEKDLDDVDLLIIAGTSLSVSPSCNIPRRVNKNKCVRLLANREPSGLKLDKNDVFFKGNCDDAFKELTELLGWTNDLNALMKRYAIIQKIMGSKVMKRYQSKQSNVTDPDGDEKKEDK